MPVVIVPSQTGVALNEMVRRTRFILEDYPIQDQITTAITDTDLSITILDRDLWDVGIRGEFDDDTGEQFLTRTQTSTTLTLRRAVYGTSAADHDADCYVLREPRFGYQQITEALTRVIESDFRNVLWNVVTGTSTPSTSDMIYSMPDGFKGLIRITQRKTTTPDDTINYFSKGSGLPVSILWDVDPNLSTSGVALRIPSVDNTTHDLQITYGENVTITTVSEGPMAEAVIMGACSRLMGGKDIYRTAQDVTQGDASVQPGAMTRSAAWYWSQMIEARRRAKEELLRRGALMT